VDCSRSVGTVPGAAPGPKRSSSVLTSVEGSLSADVAHHVTSQCVDRGYGAPLRPSTAALSISHTLQDLVGANLLLGGTSESSGLLAGGGRTGSISCW
jgi:hypothetical protein